VEKEIAFNARQEREDQSWYDEKGVFRDQHGNRFIEVAELTGVRKIMPIDSDEFKRYLRRKFIKQCGSFPEDKKINLAVKALDAMAEISPVYELHQRIAHVGAAIYIDLADVPGHVVEITADGWQVLTKSPVRFRQREDAARQVVPVRATNAIAPNLFDFINIRDPSDQLLFEVTLITCLIPKIAHPVISLIAPEGSAKTTASRILKELIDPAAADLIRFPRNAHELGLACSQNHMVSFDNMRNISKEQSDLLCQVVTGGNICVRKLYTTSDLTIIPFRSCLVLNGIDLAGQRPDLLDRTIFFSLPKIEPSQRKDETDFWQGFNAVKPQLLGRYFDVLTQAIKIYPDTKPKKKPRMADYYRWALAVTKALGRKPEEFQQAYQQNRDRIAQDSIEQEPLAAAVSALVATNGSWEGTCSELHTALVHRFDSRQLPKAPNQLSRKLKDVAGTLDKVGIVIGWGKDSDRNLTTVRLEKAS
jgi:hypothetical protein